MNSSPVRSQELHRDWEMNKANGWKMMTGIACPLRLLGKHCKGWDRCMCRNHYHILDHGRLWKTDTGRQLLVSEPYDFSAEEVIAYITDVQELGLHISFSGNGSWNTGTIRVTVEIQRSPAE